MIGDCDPQAVLARVDCVYVALHSGNAVRALRTAASTSATSAIGTLRIACPVEGFVSFQKNSKLARSTSSRNLSSLALSLAEVVPQAVVWGAAPIRRAADHRGAIPFQNWICVGCSQHSHS